MYANAMFTIANSGSSGSIDKSKAEAVPIPIGTPSSPAIIGELINASASIVPGRA